MPTDRDTITEAQARRFYAIAFDTGYTRAGINRLLERHEYDEAEDVAPEDYDELIRVARDEQLAFRFNRDPDTPDMFADH